MVGLFGGPIFIRDASPCGSFAHPLIFFGQHNSEDAVSSTLLFATFANAED